MKKVLILTTGGTIMMSYDHESGVIPSKSGAELIASVPQVSEYAHVDICEFMNIPSPHITPEKMFDLAKEVDRQIKYYDGIIITHGTDTLEETAYMLDLVCSSSKPIVFTAAMRSNDDIGVDGPRNLLSSVRTVCSPSAIGKGVMVVLNDTIFGAREVTKTCTNNVAAFESPQYGHLGVVDEDRIVFYRESTVRDRIITDSIDSRVELIKMTAGSDSKFFHTCIDAGMKGIVVEALGRGNIPPSAIEGVKKALDAKLIIIMVSRTYNGRVLDVYGYEGGGKKLKEMGVIMGGDLRGPKARIKLMVLLGKNASREEIISTFDD
ncbi:MAG: asparaginase [Candidatus Coatesbacteria bacterium]|nr:asparaginase [Candidatus Coatesbacteria bacterium]